jgi:uncharacterized protein YbjT (DUF2867 family)
MDTQTILVVGATGMLGAPVAQRLVQDGYQVRLLVRDQARAEQQLGSRFEYVQGSVDDEARVRTALAGCSGVHISLQGRSPAEFESVEHHGTARIARLAAELGVQRISYLSGALVAAETTRLPQQHAKYQAEQAIRRSGVPYTIFKPTYFMESLPLSIQGSRATVMGRSEQRFRFVAAADFARMVALAFRTPEAANRAFFVYGPEPLTMEEALRRYCRIAAPQAQVTVTPFWMMRLINRLFLDGNLTPVIEINRLNQQLGEIGDVGPTDQILGPATTTLEQWCTQYNQGSGFRTQEPGTRAPAAKGSE